MTTQDFADKCEWEGGVGEALACYFGRADLMELEDEELSHLCLKAQEYLSKIHAFLDENCESE
jgi:hypothetical protein